MAGCHEPAGALNASPSAGCVRVKCASQREAEREVAVTHSQNVHAVVVQAAAPALVRPSAVCRLQRSPRAHLWPLVWH